MLGPQAAVWRPAAFRPDSVGGISARRTATFMLCGCVWGPANLRTQRARGQALRRGGSSGHGCTLQRQNRYDYPDLLTCPRRPSAVAPYTAADTLRLAAFPPKALRRYPIDLAILRQYKPRAQRWTSAHVLALHPLTRLQKIRRRSFRREAGQMGIVKGFPQSVSALAGRSVEEDVQPLAQHGYRALAVAAGPDHQMQLVGLVALEEPPRPDSKDLLVRLQALGVRIIMVTGDGLATARAVAARVGLTGKACPAETLKELTRRSLILTASFMPASFPRTSITWYVRCRAARHVVGMTGDGVNDAPALKQAEVGIAVSTATDVAKAAASLILTTPGLGNIVAAVETGRRIFQRMLTYTLNKVIKTFQVGFFLSLGLLLTGQYDRPSAFDPAAGICQRFCEHGAGHRYSVLLSQARSLASSGLWLSVRW